LLRVALAGRDTAELLPLVSELDLRIDDKDPEVVISYGGDGTLLGAEYEWPGVPKLAIRHPRSCRKCPDHEDIVVLKRLAEGDFSRTVLMKMEAHVRGQRLVGINDITLNKVVPFWGVRYRVWINGEAYSGEIVGDGVVVSTPFGSSAYYRSISRSFFRVGIGVAFNNSTEQVDHLVLRETDRIRVQITRGPSLLCADNAPNPVQLVEGEEAEIGKAEETTVLLAADTLLCTRCRRADGTLFNRLGGLTSL
jgi:NAD+ kinase